MECSEVLKRLSEYADDELDPATKGLVEEHLSGCAACAAEWQALATLTQSIGAIERVTAPREFLENLHARLEQRSPGKRFIEWIFFPLSVKLPMEAAGVIVALLLVVTLQHGMRTFSKSTPSPTRPQAPLREAQEAPPAPAARVSPAPMPEHAGASPGKTFDYQMPPPPKTADHMLKETEAVAIVLLVKPPAQAQEDAESETGALPPAAEQSAPPRVSAQARGRAEPGSQLKASIPGARAMPRERDEAVSRKQEKPAAPLYDRASALSLVRSYIERAGGSVLAIEGKEYSDQPVTISAQVPAEKLPLLLKDLGSVGELAGPSPSLPAASREPVLLRIELRPGR